jgi:AraC family transcriptional regulator of adaptative response/methylated-DNA-[protein]-cysteine methyltransferase
MATLKLQQTKPDRLGSDDERWNAVVHRDRSADGRFYYSVLTTGVYCRPGCPSRLPRRENVGFHPSCEAAEQAGFRACKRCRPNAAGLATKHTAIVAKACRLIETAEEIPDLEKLSAAVGMSRFHFHRIFKAALGITPKAYANAHRAQLMRDALPHSATVTDAIHAAGFSANGQFYTRSETLLGMKPAHYRNGGDGLSIRFAVTRCSLGAVLVATTTTGICAILLGDEPKLLQQELRERFPKAHLENADADFDESLAKVVALVETPALGLDLPLDLRGTAFQQRVWAALREIPCGVTVNYSQVAERIGAPKQAVRAVATAIAANPLAIAVPCHRVIRRDGSLAGYRWGIERKQVLLDREAAAVGRPNKQRAASDG